MTHPRPLFVALSLALLVSAPGLGGAGEQESAAKAIDYRTSVMTVVGWNFKPMGAMLKGKIPYDQAAMARRAQDLAAAASLDFLAGFPEGSDESDDTAAKAEIWMDFEDFERKFDAFRKAAAKLAAAAQAGDREQVQAQFGATAKSCKACHSKTRK